MGFIARKGQDFGTKVVFNMVSGVRKIQRTENRRQMSDDKGLIISVF